MTGARMLVTFVSSCLFGLVFCTPLSPLTIDPFRINGDTGDGGGDKGNNGGSGDGGTMSEWSSTIGIVTAIIGNVFISFALNIQRYAHIRIEREYERNRQRNGFKRTVSGRTEPSGHLSSNHYGTLSHGDNGESADEQGHTNGSRAERNGGRSAGSREFSRVGFQRYTDEEDEDGENMADHDHERLQQSFMSDRTLPPLEKSQTSNGRKSYLRSPYWWAGIILMTVGEAGNFLAYGFAPASIVSPLGVVALISNCIIAPFMLKETFRRRDLLGVLVSVAGAVTIVLSAKTSETKIGPGEIWGMITTWEFELYLGLTVALILALMWASEKYGRKSILIDLGLVGLFGGYTALSTKGVASLLSFTLWHVITFPITYALVAVLVFSALMQIRYINRALQRFDSTQVIPTQFVLFTISVILGSAVLYRDFESTTLERAGKFVGGCALTFLGVFFITSGRARADDSESESDEEEAIGLLGEERYRDSVDWQSERRQSHPEQTFDGTAGPAVQTTAGSRPRSLLSDEEEDVEDDGMQTPRAPLSSGHASSVTSISGVSSLSPSRDVSPQRLTENPWATTPEDHPKFQSTESAPSAIESAPQTPPQVYPPPSQVLLQFPSAPGFTESHPGTNQHSPSRSPLLATPPRMKTTPTTGRHSTSSKTLNRASRNSLSKRFAPGPLLQPLSGTLTAVVAESLRRGEGSPRQRTSSKVKGKKRASMRLPLAAGEGHALETEYESDASVNGAGEDETARRASPMSPRLPGQGNTNRTMTQEQVPTLSSPLHVKKDHTRNRSLSDSWSGGLGWFDGSIRGSSGKKKQKNKSGASAAGGTADGQDAHAGPSRS
ncbi:hypothetical protein AJ79_04394 [Helicocarpus griseus UAMH5409]|uniref:DUF803 domain membrane protein n=1 Tax=Helicocarpus griseus UAMH5409 TaxID=1447875 RepID=A0A2B7XKE3_9EURO|nr:hypothetical protein AJ79_04394 [Helicocarpus griseus UAMH5409]